MLELTNANSSAAEEAKRKGFVATWGKGRIGPVGWKDAGCVNPSLKGVSMVYITVRLKHKSYLAHGHIYLA